MSESYQQRRLTTILAADAFGYSRGGQYCYRRRILNGGVIAVDGKPFGSVAEHGTFEFFNPSPTNTNIIVKSQGTILNGPNNFLSGPQR